MDILTQTGPISRETIVTHLTHDIHTADLGIEVESLNTPWGVTIILKRSGRPLPWRVTINKLGQSSIVKPHTATIPAINDKFESGQLLMMRDRLQYYILRGWI